MEEILGRDDGTLFVFSEIIGGKGNITFVKWHRCLHFFLMWQILGKYVMMFCINVVIWCFARSFRAPYRSMAQPEDGLVAARHLHHFGPGAMSWWMSSGQPMGMAEAETGHSPTVPMDFFRVPTSQMIDHAVFWFVVNMHSCCRSDREPFPHRFQIELWQIHFSTLTGSQ